MDRGYAEDEAKGYGIWLARVVAARRFGKKSGALDRARPESQGAKAGDEPTVEPKYRFGGDELQIDETFDHDIIGRMVEAFYAEVFVPAIAEARECGQPYDDIRDAICKNGNPPKSTSRR